MVKALPFIRQPDGLAREASDVSAANWRKASDVSAANWRYQTREKIKYF